MTDTKAAASHRLVMRRTFKASRARVFAAWTTPEVLKSWLAPGDLTAPEATLDVRVGGTYRITMEQPDGERFAVGGVYREIREPERLSFTFRWEGDEPSPQGDTLVTLDFYDRGAETELVLTHENFADEGSRDRHEHGWTGSFEKLASVLSRSARS
ncbi:MAG: SRPBCC domain-containing protein [bacterium]|nr:SRPBCC domain-containing protein [bacterium]